MRRLTRVRPFCCHIYKLYYFLVLKNDLKLFTTVFSTVHATAGSVDRSHITISASSALLTVRLEIVRP